MLQYPHFTRLVSNWQLFNRSFPVQQFAGQDEELKRLEEIVPSTEHVALAVKQELGWKCKIDS
jgi:hypothetical protein